MGKETHYKRSKKAIKTDGFTEMMYYYWTRKAIRPSFFYNLPQGELAIIRAFYEEYIEELNENPSMCPMMMF